MSTADWSMWIPAALATAASIGLLFLPDSVWCPCGTGCVICLRQEEPSR